MTICDNNLSDCYPFSDLGNIMRSNLLYVGIQYYDNAAQAVTFYDSQEFAKLQAVLVWRAFLYKTMSLEISKCRYIPETHFVKLADYNDGNIERFIETPMQAWYGVERLNAATALNRDIAELEWSGRTRKGCALGWREYEVLQGLKYVKCDNEYCATFIGTNNNNDIISFDLKIDLNGVHVIG